MKHNILTRFLKYVAIDTQSNSNSNSIPSTQSQLVFAEQLADELKTLGVKNILIKYYAK